MRPLVPERWSRILVRSCNWIGDVLLSQPAVAALRRACPRAHLAALARPWCAPVLERTPGVDEVLSLEPGLPGRLKAVGRLRQGRFDAAVVLPTSVDSAVLPFLAGVPVRIGYRTEGRGLLLTHGIPRRAEVRRQHQVEYYLDLLRGAGIPAVWSSPVLVLRPEDRARAAQMLEARGVGPEEGLIGISPGASYGPAKRWPAERFAGLAGRLAQAGAGRLVVFGGPGEEALGRAIAARAGDRVLDVSGRTSLPEALALIERCRLFVTNDSGLMHAAAALQVPVVALFGPTDPVLTGPAGGGAEILRRPVPCSPCHRRTCPIDHRCLEWLDTDEVYQACLRQLKI